MVAPIGIAPKISRKLTLLRDEGTASTGTLQCTNPERAQVEQLHS